MSNTFFQGGENFSSGDFDPCAPLVTGLPEMLKTLNRERVHWLTRVVTRLVFWKSFITPNFHLVQSSITTIKENVTPSKRITLS